MISNLKLISLEKIVSHYVQIMYLSPLKRDRQHPANPSVSTKSTTSGRFRHTAVVVEPIFVILATTFQISEQNLWNSTRDHFFKCGFKDKRNHVYVYVIVLVCSR